MRAPFELKIAKSSLYYVPLFKISRRFLAGAGTVRARRREAPDSHRGAIRRAEGAGGVCLAVHVSAAHTASRRAY